MTDLKRHPQTISPAEAERLLAGVRIEGKPELDQLAVLMAGVRAVTSDPPPRDVIEGQLKAISELLDRTRPQAANYALAASADRTVATDRTLRTDRTIEPVRYALMSRLWDRTMGTVRRRAYALSTAMLLASGSAAAAGVLPDAAQDALADAAARVGITIPHADEGARTETNDVGGDAQDVKPASENAGEVAVAVHEVIATRDQYGNGHDFGQAVAQAARDAAEARREARHANAKDGTPAADGTTGRPSEPGSQGKATAGAATSNAPDGGRAFGDQKAREGRSRSPRS